MISKSSLQKTYEKFAMIRKNPERLGVMIAVDSDGKHHIILGLDVDEDGGIPVGDLLHGNSIARLTPLRNAALNTKFQENFANEDRTTLAEFNKERIMREFSDGLRPDDLD